MDLATAKPRNGDAVPEVEAEGKSTPRDMAVAVDQSSGGGGVRLKRGRMRSHGGDGTSALPVANAGCESLLGLDKSRWGIWERNRLSPRQ